MPESRRVTSKDVAEAAGVSQSLVSLVLNDVPGKKIKPETRERVMESARALGYQVSASARSMRAGRAGAIGLLCPWDGTMPSVLPLFISKALARLGSSLVVCTPGDGWQTQYRQQRFDGIILVENPLEGEQDRALVEQGVACASLSFCLETSQSRLVVGIRQEDVGRMAVKHLAGAGCRRLGYVLERPLDVAHPLERLRLEGVFAEAEAAGVSLRVLDVMGKAEEISARRRAIEKLVGLEQFDGFLSGAAVCLDIAEYVRGQERKAAVLCLEDTPDGEHQGLTSMALPLEDLAAQAAGLVMGALDEASAAARRIVLLPRVVARASTLLR